MCVIDTQVFVFYLCIIVTSLECLRFQAKSKRSPLEHGHVEFETPFIRAPTTFPAVLGTLKENFKTNKNVMTTKGQRHSHYRDEWIPGHVDHHHTFIPGHIHHILIPSHAVFINDAVVVSHNYEIPYRHHYGGFGVGLDSGGHGAGHGFHVWHAYSLDI